MLALFIMSCERNNKYLIDSHYADEITVKNNEFILPTKDELFLRDYNMISSLSNNRLDIIVAYNYRTHALDLFSPQTNYLTQVKLDEEGGNGILPNIEGLYFHTLDSIWIYNRGIIYLTDTAGIVQERIDIGDLQHEEIIIDANFSISRVNLYYNKKRKSLLYTTRVIQQKGKPLFQVYEYFLNDKNVKKHALSGSDYDSDIMLLYGWKNAPNVTFSDDYIIYNYPIESNIYTLNLNDNSKKTFGGKSKYTKNSVHKLSKNTDFDDAERHKIENVHFFEITYNHVLDLYFRLHVDRNDYLKNENTFVQFNKKNMYLMVFNNKFEVIYENQLSSNRYSIINSWCIVNNGFLMLVNNHFFNAEIDEDVIVFDILEPNIK